MKAKSKIFISILTLFFTLVITSCLTNQEAKMFSPQDTWIKDKVSYTDDNGKMTELICYFYYSDTGTTTRKETIKPGLTVVLTAASDLSYNTIAQNKYVIKNFPDGQRSVVDGKSFTVNSNLWTALGVARGFYNKTYVTPPCIDDAGYTRLESFEDIKIKRIIAQMLVDKLIE